MKKPCFRDLLHYFLFDLIEKYKKLSNLKNPGNQVFRKINFKPR